MAKGTKIAGYTYYTKKSDVPVTSNDDVVKYEVGLGWYKHSRKEYATNPRKRIFGF